MKQEQRFLAVGQLWAEHNFVVWDTCDMIVPASRKQESAFVGAEIGLIQLRRPRKRPVILEHFVQHTRRPA